jgi:hypothetical protein
VPEKVGPKKRKKYLGPESDFWDELKGKTVRIQFADTKRPDMVARLDWVDRFTIGLRDTVNGRRFMLFKHVLHSLEKGFSGFEGDDKHGTTTDPGRL